MNVNDILLNLGLLTILAGTITAMIQWHRRKLVIGGLTAGLLLVMIGQVMSGHNEAWLLLVVVLVGGRKLFMKH